MFEKDLENLNSSEKEDFRRIANYLLSHTYLVRHEYQSSRQMTLPNREYQIVSRLFELFRDYFAISGWRLEKDENYGIISLTNTYEHNRLQLNRFTTLFLYMCRLIYEEGREEAGSFHTVRTDTQTVVEKMQTLGLIGKETEKGRVRGKTTKKERIEAQRTLAHFNIIRKMENSPWDGEGNKILILPSILSIIPNQEINTMYSELEDLKYSPGNEEAAETGSSEDETQ
ncbi:DUF4194 domain-containing protein [Treponema primitia]|uniref:DUF4194 domain-containing protein n=1 Tax=Treponema primitia TaxID=88058 RepID=UPI0039806395